MAGEPTLIGSVRRALHLLDAVGAASSPLPAKALARRTGQRLPTTYHLLRTLVHEGYLRRVDGGYVLGDRVSALVGPGTPSARAARIRPILRGLHDDLHAAAYLSLLDDGEIRLVEVVDSPAAPRVDLWVGFSQAAHATALGKAVLSALPEQDRRGYLSAHELPDLTQHTITDPAELLRRLGTSRDYALDREEYALGTACVATAVPSPTLVGAVAVSVPVQRVGPVLDHGDVLRRAARLVAYAVAEDAAITI